MGQLSVQDIMNAGASRSAQVAFTRPSNTTAYTANDVVGDTGGSAIHAFAIGSASGEALMITSAMLRIDLASVPSGMVAFRLHLYNASPDAIADNAAFAFSSAGDRGKYQGYIDFAAPAVHGSTLVSLATVVNLQTAALAAQTLYGVLVTLGAFTPASATTWQINLAGVKP